MIIHTYTYTIKLALVLFSLTRSQRKKMRTIMDLGKQKSHLQIIDSPTNVDCAREVGLRRTLRSLIEWVIPYCCTYQPPPSDQNDTVSVSSSTSSSDQSGVVVTGTFFGHRRGHVSSSLLSASSPPRASRSHGGSRSGDGRGLSPHSSPEQKQPPV